METIKFDDFKKVDLRVGKILEVEEIEGADKLYLLTVDIGDETRKLVAGIKPWYEKEQLIGKIIIVVANLEPKKIKGIESNGMLLATLFDNKLSILTTDKEDVPAGSKIT
ncbi:methionine--tRNA ligase subunit beta [bacterium]|nr:methionine--tRNA ligase subunit beta [bacterium]